MLLLDKPAGITSFSAVYKIRRALGVKKVGHAGTLDPAATGLLIVLTGAATRRQSQFMGLDKEYLATVLLGVETDTWDLDGEICEERTVTDIEQDIVKQLLIRRFYGRFDQIPPAFSAIKKQGVPSYRRARRGDFIIHEPRSVMVNSLELVEWAPPEFTLKIGCSSGFYVRSLAHDIGSELGCGGVLKRLCRTGIGEHRVEAAFALDELLGKLPACRK